MDIDIPESPITNEEIYLASALGEYEGELPAPVTDIQKYLYALAQNVSVVAPVIIYAESHTTKETYVVPVLTDDQITNAYNGIVAGRSVIIVDDLDTISIRVLEGSNIDDVSITLLFTDKLILTYKVGGEIIATKIATSSNA